MIKLKAYDVEVLPNFFSVTIVDINSYLKVFSEAYIINKKGKKEPIHLTDKYSVKEIKEKLKEVEVKSFYITDTNDSQLLSMLGYINSLTGNDGNSFYTSHSYGYNSSKYDKLMVAALLSYYGIVDSTKKLIEKLYEVSQLIISNQDNKEILSNNYIYKTLSTYKLPYKDVDIMKIFALNKVGKGTNSKGETIYFGKSLKQTSINLKWYELLEHDLPPISEKDAHFYTKYYGLTTEELNKIVNKWDRYIIDEWIPDIIHYNANDVFIVCEMFRLYIDEIKLRYQISKAYGIDVISSSRSNIADRLFEKFYSEFSGLKPFQWKGKYTQRTVMSFKRIILPFIEFKTPELQLLLSEMKHTSVTSLGKDSFKKEIKLNNLIYTIATGGLHSQDIPRELISHIEMNNSSTGESDCEAIAFDNITNDSYIYVHFDISSFYPSMMVQYKIAPAHIDNGCFVKLIKWLRDTRVEAKHSKEDIIDGIPKEILAQALKIVINSIYGKLGFERGDICDRLAVLNVTINGQLLIMMLCEELELNGIEVMSANTDGIVVKLYKRDKEKFDNITKEWCEKTGLSGDSEEYNKYINRDINNYITEELNGKITYKGAMNPKMYAVDLQKGYDMPVVAQAVSNYFLNDKPIMESLYECKDILDFCKTQNVGNQFYVEYATNKGYEKLQKNVRFYVSMSGGYIYKVHNINNTKNNLCAGYKTTILNTLDDKRIELRNINYQYYYDECMKIINPIKLSISPNMKANPLRKTKSGKAIIKKNSEQFLSLFEDD